MPDDESAREEQVPELSPLLAAALRAFALYGVRRVTIDDIAKQAGVSRTTVWRALGSKRKIQQALAIALSLQTVGRMREAIPAGTPIVDALAQVVILAHRSVFDNPVAVRVLDHEPASMIPIVSDRGDGSPSMYLMFGEMIGALLRERCPDVERLKLSPEAAVELAFRSQVSFLFARKTRLPEAGELTRMLFAGLLEPD